MLRSLITERTITYLSTPPGLAAGTYFNGKVAASTSASAAAVGLWEGKGIRIKHAQRALVAIALGVLTTGLLGTITAWVSSASEKADGATLTQIPNFSLSYVDTDDGKILKGEIDLRGIAGAYAAGDTELNLWIKHLGTGVNVSITVQLDGFDYEPAGDVADVLAPLALN